MAYRHSYVRQPSFKYQGMTRSEATRSIAKRFVDALLGR